MRSVLRAALAILLAASAALVRASPALAAIEANEFNITQIGVKCDASVDARAIINAATSTGGIAAGKTLRVPAGCKILVSTPGAGASAITLASRTKVECEDQSAGFVLAARRCSSGSTFPGAACVEDTDCLAGTCQYEGDATASFAPTEASTYTVFDAEASAIRPELVGCTIWVNQDNGKPQELGGNGIRHGRCDDAGTSNANQACGEFCNSSSGALYGVACTDATSATVCGATLRCTLGDATCTLALGACAATSYRTAWGGSGAGKIHPIDFSSTSYAHIEDVKIVDQRRGDFAVKVGTLGNVRRVDADIDSLDQPQADTWLNWARRTNVSAGFDLGFSTSISDSEACAWDYAFKLAGGNIVTGCNASGSADCGAITESGNAAGDWKGGVGYQILSYDVIVTNSFATTFVGVNSGGTGGYNFQVTGNRIAYGAGPKVILGGSGNQIQANYMAWGTHGNVLSLGDPRGYCDGGPRLNKLCLLNTSQNPTYGCPYACAEDSTKACAPKCAGGAAVGTVCDVNGDCPASTCNANYDCATTCTTSGTMECDAHADFPNASTNHALINANLIHTNAAAYDRRSGATYLGMAQSKRCSGGSTPNKPCTVGGDCTGGAGCLDFTHANLTSVANIFYNGAFHTAIDLDEVGVTTRANLMFGPNDYNGPFETLLKLPAYAQGTCSSGFCITYNATAACSLASDCGNAVDVHVSGLAAGGATTLATNWDWRAGWLDVRGLAAANDQPFSIVTLSSDEALSKGHIVTASSSTTDRVVKATSSLNERAVGVSLNATTSAGDAVKVATSGKVRCVADGTIAKQDALKIASTAGRVITASGTDLVVGVAAEAGTVGNEFDCFFTNYGRTNAEVGDTIGYMSTNNGQNIATATLTTITGMSVSVAANTTYRVHADVFLDDVESSDADIAVTCTSCVVTDSAFSGNGFEIGGSITVGCAAVAAGADCTWAFGSGTKDLVGWYAGYIQVGGTGGTLSFKASRTAGSDNFNVGESTQWTVEKVR